MDLVIGDYMLTPYGSERCWELHEWRPEHVAKKGRTVGKLVAAGWVSLGRYPSTLELGVSMVTELLLMNKDGEARESEEIYRMVSEVKKEVLDALRIACDSKEG